MALGVHSAPQPRGKFCGGEVVCDAPPAVTQPPCPFTHSTFVYSAGAGVGLMSQPASLDDAKATEVAL
jgi:hypothetical protein